MFFGTPYSMNDARKKLMWFHFTFEVKTFFVPFTKLNIFHFVASERLDWLLFLNVMLT